MRLVLLLFISAFLSTGIFAQQHCDRYSFKVYVLDDRIELKHGSSEEELKNAMSGYVIAYGELVGIYGKV
ncbi:MAG TPA: hypothetical protein VFJ43_11690 [Bacteroidia bacterium]|nr:hypothetical protein [Bacteroidia bacterium]